MWEHAEGVVHIPEAIKSTLEIVEYFHAGGTETTRASDGKLKLSGVRTALGAFASDALELSAYKRLHAITNQFTIDLRDTFAMIGPDVQRARDHHKDLLQEMEKEWQGIRETKRAANQLARL